jgi:hypothetical protein
METLQRRLTRESSTKEGREEMAPREVQITLKTLRKKNKRKRDKPQLRKINKKIH